MGNFRQKETSQEGTIMSGLLSVHKGAAAVPMDKETSDLNQHTDLQDAFNVLDLNGKGKIDTSDLKTVFGQLGIKYTDEEVKKMIKKVDLDQNGYIEPNEFHALLTKDMNTVNPEQELRDTFDMLDTNGDGSISKKELRDGMMRVNITMTEEELDVMIEQAAGPNKSEVDYAAYKNMYLNARDRDNGFEAPQQ